MSVHLILIAGLEVLFSWKSVHLVLVKFVARLAVDPIGLDAALARVLELGGIGRLRIARSELVILERSSDRFPNCRKIVFENPVIRKGGVSLLLDGLGA